MFNYLQISFFGLTHFSFFSFSFVCYFIQSQVIDMPLGNKVTGLKEHYDNYNKITATTNQSPLVYTAGKLH